MIINQQLTYKIISNKENEIKNITFKIHENEMNGMFIIHRAAIKQLSQKRSGNAHTKTRSEVRGGGRKPWKQKGTGRARAGSIRSPLWKGGGITFGPRNRKYIHKINKKEKQLALRTLLVNKFKTTTIIDYFIENFSKPNTKMAVDRLKDLGFNINKKEKLIIIVDKKEKNLFLSIRNLKNIDLIAANQVNIISLLRADKLIITKDGLNQIAQIYND